MPFDPLFILARRYLWARGYKAVPRAPLDLRGRGLHPLDALESAVDVRRAVVDLPVDRLRSHLFFRLTDAAHPFVAFLHADVIGTGGFASYAGSVLEDFYRTVRPVSAADLLAPDGGAPELEQLPPTAYARPWLREDPERALALHRKWEAIDALQNGADLSPEDGCKFFGPVSVEKGELEAARLVGLTRSMAARGYVRDDSTDGDIGGNLLVGEGGAWCVDVRRGQHRAAVAVALGAERLPVALLTAPARRSEAARWPLVRSGVFTAEAAVAHFDRVMAGKPPPVYDGWCHASERRPPAAVRRPNDDLPRWHARVDFPSEMGGPVDLGFDTEAEAEAFRRMQGDSPGHGGTGR